jgi:hypothetical protein
VRFVTLDTAGVLLHPVMRNLHVAMTGETDLPVGSDLLVRLVADGTVETGHRGVGRKGLAPRLNLLMTLKTGLPIRQESLFLCKKVVAIGAMHERHFLARPLDLIGMAGQAGVDRPDDLVDSLTVAGEAVDPYSVMMSLVSRRLPHLLPVRILT